MVNPRPKNRRVREDEPKSKVKKAEGEWRYKTIAEFKASDTVAWRAQISIAPDGGKFAGSRKVITKKAELTAWMAAPVRP